MNTDDTETLTTIEFTQEQLHLLFAALRVCIAELVTQGKMSAGVALQDVQRHMQASSDFGDADRINVLHADQDKT